VSTKKLRCKLHLVWFDTFGLVWFGLVWFGLVWFGLIKTCEGGIQSEALFERTYRSNNLNKIASQLLILGKQPQERVISNERKTTEGSEIQTMSNVRETTT
jgi:hypothetical protein